MWGGGVGGLVLFVLPPLDLACANCSPESHLLCSEMATSPRKPSQTVQHFTDADGSISPLSKSSALPCTVG